jgi:hypothetical protein
VGCEKILQAEKYIKHGFYQYILQIISYMNEQIIGSYQSSEKIFRVRFMVFNATFNNISVISWRSGLLGEET